MDCIKKDFNDIKISSKDDFNITYTNKVRSDWERDFHNGKTMQYYFHEQEKEAENILDLEYGYYQHKNHKKFTAICGIFFMPRSFSLHALQ